MDRIIVVGGYISVNTGQAPDANAIPIPTDQAEAALDAASCIGCAACIASCKNASASLFTGSKVAHLAGLPQGDAEAHDYDDDQFTFWMFYFPFWKNRFAREVNKF